MNRLLLLVLALGNYFYFNTSQVDPIVASFSGGAVGVISALMVVEINNVKLQEHKRCKYCLGTGMLLTNLLSKTRFKGFHSRCSIFFFFCFFLYYLVALILSTIHVF